MYYLLLVFSIRSKELKVLVYLLKRLDIYDVTLILKNGTFRCCKVHDIDYMHQN